MRLLLTGATGFIGARVARAAVERGWDVVAVSRAGADRRRLADIAPQITLVEHDIGQDMPAAVLGDLRADACIHLAWYAEPGKYLTAPENLGCLTSSLNLVRDLVSAACGSIVVAGTCAEYAGGDSLLRETDPTSPATIYAACKLSLGEVAKQLAAGTDTNVSAARLFYLYGPGEDPRRAVPDVIRRLLAGERVKASTGDQLRDYLHVDDVADALCTMAERRAQGTYNVASADPISVRRLFTRIGEQMGRADLIDFGALPPRPWDPPFIAGDNTRLRSLGWQPRRPLDTGIADTIAWWRAQGAVSA